MKKYRPNDLTSMPHRSYIYLNGYTWSFLSHENDWVLSVILVFALFNVFRNRHSTRNTFLPKFDNYVDPEHITYFRTYRSAWTVMYMKTFLSFRYLIYRLVCTLQSNQRLDALIKYVA